MYTDVYRSEATSVAGVASKKPRSSILVLLLHFEDRACLTGITVRHT